MLLYLSAVALLYGGDLTGTDCLRIYFNEAWQARKLVHAGIIVARIGEGWLTGYAGADQKRLLRALGLRWEAEQCERAAREGYHSYDEMVAELTQLAAAYPGLCTLFSIGQSVQGRELYFVKISDNVAQEELEPEVHYISTMHGNEPLGTELCLYLVRDLLENYGSDAYITGLVDDLQIFIMPLMNPDGYEVRSRGNAQGVDLNRNFPDFVTDPNNTPQGRAPETAAMMNFLAQRRGVLSANFHTGNLVVNYPWDSTLNFHPENDLIYDVSLNRYACFNTPMYNHHGGIYDHGTVRGAVWYVVHGGMQDYSYYWHNNLQVTVELSYDFEPPAAELAAYYADNYYSLLYYIGACRRGLQGRVTDGTAPVAARLRFSGLDWDFYSQEDTGFFHKPLLPGTYSVSVSAFGFEEQEVSDLVVDTDYDFWTDVGDIVLVPASQTVTLQGRVTDQVSGLPVAGADVCLLDTPLEPVLTDARGGYVIADIPAGTYQVRVDKRRYHGLQQTVACVGDPVICDFTLVYAVLFEDCEAGSGNWLFTGDWCFTDRDSFSADYSLADNATGLYGQNVNSYARMTEPVDVRGAQAVYLDFYTRYSLEEGCDFVYVDISPDGAAWTQVHAFTGSTDWRDFAAELAVAGWETLYTRFRFESDDYLCDTGILIDDVGWYVYRDLPWDLNRDGIVNARDLGVALSCYGGSTVADFDHNGVVDDQDIRIIAQHMQ